MEIKEYEWLWPALDWSNERLGFIYSTLLLLSIDSYRKSHLVTLHLTSLTPYSLLGCVFNKFTNRIFNLLFFTVIELRVFLINYWYFRFKILFVIFFYEQNIFFIGDVKVSCNSIVCNSCGIWDLRMLLKFYSELQERSWGRTFPLFTPLRHSPSHLPLFLLFLNFSHNFSFIIRHVFEVYWFNSLHSASYFVI